MVCVAVSLIVSSDDGINKQSFTDERHTSDVQFMYWRTVFMHFTSTPVHRHQIHNWAESTPGII